ncbi:hypothetical protein FRC12_008161 [Ceratobasidium sp. 428]|nr:hypothetical protein FRC12_008161 [Ceratobasidium sp. 428]
MEAKESCSGCIYPFYVGQKTGVDCTKLHGVHETTFCFLGQCQIHEHAFSRETTQDESSRERSADAFRETTLAEAEGLMDFGLSTKDAPVNNVWILGHETVAIRDALEEPRPESPNIV